MGESGYPGLPGSRAKKRFCYISYTRDQGWAPGHPAFFCPFSPGIFWLHPALPGKIPGYPGKPGRGFTRALITRPRPAILPGTRPTRPGFYPGIFHPAGRDFTRGTPPGPGRVHPGSPGRVFTRRFNTPFSPGKTGKILWKF